jgi:GDP-4-dehydro-6-deoxy-D-mannose reductase
MRVLITGSSGFVGKHLTAYAASQGAEVFGLSRHAAKGIHCDLSDAAAVERAVQEIKPDRVFHLAAQSSVAESWKFPELTLRTNVLGAVNLLEALKKHAAHARVHITGSGEQLHDKNPYGISKLAQDRLAELYHRSYGLAIVRTRAYNHSGPGQDEKFVIPGFAKQIARMELKRQEPVLKTGNLDLIRDFTDVRDIVRAYWLCLEKGRAGDVYEVASGSGRSLKDIISGFRSLSSIKFEVVQDPERLRAMDTPSLIGDPSRIEHETGWKPQIGFDQMLKDVLNDWRQRVAVNAEPTH